MTPGRSSDASRSRRDAESAKSARRSSPEPFVVRSAAFVRPIPYRSTSNCSLGSRSRGVKPASWSNRQKSLRGFAKCARAAADTRPGLMPQKTTRRSGARTSGTADSGGFWLDELVRVTCVEILLEAATESLAFDSQHVARDTRLEPQHLDGRLPASVAARVALRFAQTTQPSHSLR